MILADTNILIRLTDSTDVIHPHVKSVVRQLLKSGELLTIVPQCMYEYWSTATKPVSAQGLGLSVPECILEMARFKTLFVLLFDDPTLYQEWERLVTTHACHVRVSFDARLVAAMNTHGIDTLLTLNAPDFRRYPGITLIDPLTVVIPP